MPPDNRERQTGLRISVAEGCVSNVHLTLTGGILLTGLALYFGATAFDIGLLAAIPALATSFGFLSALLVSRLGARRLLTTVTSGVGRGLFLIPALLIYSRSRHSVALLIGVVALYNVLLTIAGNAWLSWMTDLVPASTRGRYFAIRNSMMSAVGMASSLAGGRLLDICRARGQEGTGFIIILLVAGGTAAASAVLLRFQPEPAVRRPRLTLAHVVRVPLADRNFRRFLVFVGFWYLTSSVAGPFFGVHMLANLGLSYSAGVLYGILAGAVSLVCQIFWGRAIDRFKCKPVLGLNLLCAGFLPWLWLLATRRFLWPIWIDALLTGIFWTGINLALFNLVIALAVREEYKESYFALFNAVTGIAGFVSTLLGGVLATLLRPVNVSFLGQQFINYHVLFVIAGLARVVSVGFLRRVEEPRATSSLYLLEVAGGYALRRLAVGKDLILDTLRLTRPRTPQT